MSDLRKILEDDGYVAVRQMKNGEWIGVSIQLFTFGLCVGMDEHEYKRRYCYQQLTDALVAAMCYEGEGDPIGPWIKVKGEGGERHGPGFQGIIDERGDIDINTVTVVLAAVGFLVLSYFLGYDVGRRNFVMDIDTYGCEKVVTAYHGVKK